MLVLNKVGYKLTQYAIDKEKMLYGAINGENFSDPISLAGMQKEIGIRVM